MATKEKIVADALRKLSPFLMRNLNPQETAMDLYGRSMLTYLEYESIRTQNDNMKANTSLLAALRHRGEYALDELLEALKAEEAANRAVIEKIQAEYKPPLQETGPSRSGSGAGFPTSSPEQTQLLMGNGDWPTSETSSPSSPTDPPRAAGEFTDFNPKLAYRMESKPRGMAIIINNRHFTCGMKERVGTDKDAKSLLKLFVDLGFYTNRFDNLTGKDMHKKLREMARRDHSKTDCTIVAILSHGISGRLYSTDGDLIPIEEITKYFDGMNCPSLIGKPKIFIIQACRGGKFDYGVELETTDSATPLPEPQMMSLVESQYDNIAQKALDEEEFEFDDGTEETDGRGGSVSTALPVEADMVLAYATVPGYVSWRNSEYGSWFIKAFVGAVYDLSTTEHFMDILVEVNRRVAEDFQSKGRNKQIPAPVTMLTRKLYLRPLAK